jgi:hypothetical protein
MTTTSYENGVKRKPFRDDDYRRTLALAHAGWWGTALIVGGRAIGLIPQEVGALAFLTIGGAVTASLTLSRMRLADTVSQVFHVGLQSAITLSANVFTDTCIMTLDGDGKIEGVDHADAIGWDEREIVGRELRALLSPRSRGVRVLRPGTSMTSPMLNQGGEMFDARLSFAALHTNGPEKRESMIVTVSPVIAINAEGNYTK